MHTHNICFLWRNWEKYPRIFHQNYSSLKAPYSSKIDIFLSKKIYCNNTTKCDIWQPAKFTEVKSLVFELDQKYMIFYHISELMLATLIQRYDKASFIFYPVQEWETNWNFTDCQVQHFMIVLIPYINLLNLSWIIKCQFLRNMEPLTIRCLVIYV